jgi:ferric-dicitrate binding protein FerR (iron transport regulator)
MKPDYDPSYLDELLQRLIDNRLTEEEVRSLNRILRGSAQARAHYRTTLQLHAALIRHQKGARMLPMVPSIPRWRRWVIPASAAAAGLLLAGGIFHQTRPVAVLSGTTSAIWSGVAEQEALSLAANQTMDLVSGFAEVSFRSGVRVILEGPCRFVVTSASSMEVSHGRATVKVPQAIDGFHLDTPAGRITDLGTEFGVAVGSGVEGPVILTEVFAGEIEIPAEETPRKRLQCGDSLAIVGESGGTRLVSTLGDYRIDLGDIARRLPEGSVSSPVSGNLALGKPVSSPAHYAKSHGSIFPPKTLTDGRLNDTGSPGDWSFWLAPNGDAGEFTVDLLGVERIGRIEIQNTRNRTYGDRGLREISIQVSEDDVNYHEVARAELSRIPVLPGPGVDFPFESIEIEPVNARYVKVIGLSHYRNEERPPEEPNEGGGLNEIRIFAP